MKRSISLLALLLTVACSSSTEPGNKPTWADNTSWNGNVVMKSGTNLRISFHLTTDLVTDLMTQHDVWAIGVDHAHIENARTGIVAKEFPEEQPGGLLVGASVRADYALQLSMVPTSAFDPSVPTSCPNAAQPSDFPIYTVNLQIAGDGTLRGTVNLSCFANSVVFDSQPIVMQRI
jgi:hypothetical protein